LFDRYLLICIDAHFACNLHCFFSNLPGRKLGMLGQRLGGGLGIGSSAANGRNSRVRLDHIALAAEQKRLLFIGNEQQGLQMAQKFVGTPVFGEFDRRAANIAVVLLQLGLKAAEKRKSVGGGTRESRQDFLLIKPPDLAGIVLDHTFTKRDLSVPGHDNAAIAADAKNCSGANQTFCHEDEALLYSYITAPAVPPAILNMHFFIASPVEFACFCYLHHSIGGWL